MEKVVKKTFIHDFIVLHVGEVKHNTGVKNKNHQERFITVKAIDANPQEGTHNLKFTNSAIKHTDSLVANDKVRVLFTLVSSISRQGIPHTCLEPKHILKIK